MKKLLTVALASIFLLACVPYETPRGLPSRVIEGYVILGQTNREQLTHMIGQSNEVKTETVSGNTVELHSYRAPDNPNESSAYRITIQAQNGSVRARDTTDFQVQFTNGIVTEITFQR
ncbi:MAG: hypothetical protein LBJ61_03795 [Deltaproteobacteria bacterium]|jgi:hypothetical protein|nr:hypothetical protein [Deltaproteobacteria bacterium]